MKFFRRINYILSALAVAILCSLGGSMAAFAAEEEIPDYRLQISPVKVDIGDMNPGESYTNSVRVQNTGKNAFDYKMSVVPFAVKDEQYTQDYNNPTQYNDIVEWVKFSKDTGHLEPNTQEEVVYTITVPADVPAGGQYAILMAEIDNENVEGVTGVNIVRRVGTSLYSNVHGATRKEGKVLENKVPSFRFNPPINATSIVENTGNTHTDAKYILQVYPLFSDEEIYTNEEKPDTLTILPDTRRFNTVSWPGSPALGIFRVRQTVTIWSDTMTTEKVVFLCPIWLLFIVLLIIFCAIFWIVSRIRSRKQR